MEPHGWQGGVLVPVILLLALQVLPSVADCQHDDLSDYTEHTEPVYGATNKDTYGEGETVQYMCQGGFYPKAPGPVTQYRTAVCRNGRWDKSGQSPLTCVGRPQLPQGCVEPHFPHGRIIGPGRHSVGSVVYHDFDAIAIFDCDDGQRTSARCLQSGDWSSKPPTCTVLTSVSCGNPFPGGSLSNGRPDSLVFNFPSIIKVTCNPGYRLVAHDGSEWGTKILSCQSNGQWNRQAPKCMQVVCQPTRDIPHGRVIHSPAGGPLHENATATYQCSGKNYVLKGPAVRRCQNDGTWSDTEPICQGFDGCVKPDLPNGRVVAVKAEMLGNISYYPYDTTVILACDDGSKTSSKCLPLGSWNPEPPVCSATKKRRLARARSLASTYAADNTAYYVDAAEDRARPNYYTAVAIAASDGTIRTVGSFKATDSHHAEELAIALAATDPRCRTILSDSRTAILRFANNTTSTSTVRFLHRTGQTRQHPIFISWYPAHAARPGGADP
ncbi:CUB and sushi domain-containing protein 3-like isoform X2 [Haemaphysalis longicornis]